MELPVLNRSEEKRAVVPAKWDPGTAAEAKDYRKYELSENETAGFYAAVFSIGAAVSLVCFRNVFFALLIIPFIGKIKEQVEGFLLGRRKRRMTEQFKDFLFMISTAVGSGRSMKDAIKAAIPELEDVHGSDCELVSEMRTVYDRLEVGNENDVDVLMDLAVRSGIEDMVDFVTIYSTCKATGASLIIALKKAAGVIIDKMSIEREITELVRRKESEGLVIFLMPVIVICFLNMTSPDYIAPMYDSWIGRAIMAFVILSNIGVYFLIKKIVHVEI